MAGGEMEWLVTIARVAFVAAVFALVVGQCRKPSGWVGRFHIWSMNRRHAGVTAWGLGHVSIEPAFVILDIGCGGGKAVERLAALAHQGHVCGVDYSAASVAAARSTNTAAIAEGRVEIRQAPVSALPFEDGTFDLVTAVETHYYWPQPVSDLREILRVLKPGGRLAIIAETYRGQTLDMLLRIPMALLRARYLTIEEHETLLMTAGFTEITVDTAPHKGWICAVGRRPRHAETRA
jgi:SAM-dependent methyltransferase